MLHELLFYSPFNLGAKIAATKDAADPPFLKKKKNDTTAFYTSSSYIIRHLQSSQTICMHG